MGHFNFRFQPVLELKKQIEDSCKNELGKAVKKFESEKELLSAIELEKEACMDQMAESSGGSINVVKMREYNIFLQKLKKNVEIQKENLKSADKMVSSCRSELTKAMIKREVLDKLKEKQEYEFSRRIIIKEQNLSDEISGYRYRQNASGN